MRVSHLIALLGVFVACGAGMTIAQEQPPADIVRAAQASDAAFRCAVLAALAVPTGEESPDTIRLARYALAMSRTYSEWMAPRMINTPAATGTWKDFLSQVGTDFWVGMAYASANQWVDQRMNTLAPILAGESSEDWSTRRQLQAGAEYASQNCSLIGP